MRFGFGKNWKNFLQHLSEDRIVAATQSLQQRLGMPDLRDKTFLDIGSGSGLFSLAANRLNARVHSFDYDPDSVACTQELQKKFGTGPWKVEQGSVLDTAYLKSLGQFDVTYSWGVLHHTGEMWTALANVCDTVVPGGYLFIAIYNDQGLASRVWTRIKKAYNAGSWPIRAILVLLVGFYSLLLSALTFALHGKKPASATDQAAYRGMRRWNDLVDWIGGYPFEVARPDTLINFYLQRGFELKTLKTVGNGHGCNEYVFRKKA